MPKKFNVCIRKGATADSVTYSVDGRQSTVLLSDLPRGQAREGARLDQINTIQQWMRVDFAGYPPHRRTP